MGPYTSIKRTTPVPSNNNAEEDPGPELKHKTCRKSTVEKDVTTVFPMFDEDEDFAVTHEPVRTLRMTRKEKICIANKKWATTLAA